MADYATHLEQDFQLPHPKVLPVCLNAAHQVLHAHIAAPVAAPPPPKRRRMQLLVVHFGGGGGGTGGAARGGGGASHGLLALLHHLHDPFFHRPFHIEFLHRHTVLLAHAPGTANGLREGDRQAGR